MPLPPFPARLTLALLLLSAPAAVAQFGEKVAVHYVEVPVTVTRDGAPVRGLTRANFEIYDDGQKREIESFEAIDFTSADPSRTLSPLNPAARRNFLLVFDLSYASPISVGRAQEAARNFIARSVGRRDLVGVAVIDVERGFRFLTSFTTDRTLLAQAIRDPRNFRAFDPLQIAGSAADSIITVDPAIAGEAGSRNERGDAGAEVAADLKRSVQAADDAYRRARVQKQIQGLSDLARTLQRLAGRKHLVLLSEGFDARLVQGRSVAENVEQQEENQAVSVGEIWKVDSDKRFGNTTAQRLMQDMAEVFRRADVVLHAVDIQGVRVQNDARTGRKVNLNDGLFLLAGATGGEVFRNTNNLDSDFDSLLRHHEVVYVLGFRAPAGSAGQFHPLRVKLVNVPAARAQHRGGYYAAGGEGTIERSLSTAEIVLNDLPQNDIDVAALATAFPARDGLGSVPVILEIAGPDLIGAARTPAATLDLFVYAFDDSGVVRDRIYQRVQLDLEKVGQKLNRAGVKFYGTLALPPGRYAIKTLVRQVESERSSFRRIDIDVPATGDVAMLQPIFFAEAGDWIMVKASPRREPAPGYPFVLDGQTFIPAARATVRRGEPRRFTVWVWNARPDELSWEITPEAKLVSRSDGAIVTKYVFALEQVPPGASELGVTIRRKGSEEARRMSVPIRVQ